MERSGAFPHVEYLSLCRALSWAAPEGGGTPYNPGNRGTLSAPQARWTHADVLGGKPSLFGRLRRRPRTRALSRSSGTQGTGSRLGRQGIVVPTQPDPSRQSCLISQPPQAHTAGTVLGASELGENVSRSQQLLLPENLSLVAGQRARHLALVAQL